MERSALRDAIDDLAAEDRSHWSGAARSECLIELLEARERLDAELLRAVGEWDAARDWRADGACTPVAWLAYRTPIARPEAARLVRSARLACEHERTGKLLASGDVSTAHVDVLARAVRHREDLYGDHEDTLLDAARDLRPEQFREVARRWRSLADDALASEEAHERFERRFLHCSTTLAGTVRVDGELDPEGGAVVIAALDALDKPDPVQADERARTASQRRADALVTLAGGRGRAITIDVVVDAENPRRRTTRRSVRGALRPRSRRSGDPQDRATPGVRRSNRTGLATRRLGGPRSRPADACGEPGATPRPFRT